MKSLVGTVLNGGIDMKIVPTRLFVSLLAICLLCASTYAEAQTAAETAFGNFQESRQICKEIAVRLEGQSELQAEIIAVRDFGQRDRLLVEKSQLDKDLLRRYQRQSAGQGVYLGNSFHGAALANFIKNSDGLYCGVGGRHLKDAEAAGGSEASWKLRRIYLNAVYQVTLLPWLQCCHETSTDDLLKFVEEAAAIHRGDQARKNLRSWGADIENRTLRGMYEHFKINDLQKTENSTEAFRKEYRAGIQRDTMKFISDLKKLAK